MAFTGSLPTAVFHRRRLLQFVTFLAVLLTALPAVARTNLRFCFPQTAWFGGASPTVDGNAFNNGTIMDNGWRGAFRYVFDNATNGTPYSNIEIHGIRDANALYLGLEVHKAVPFADGDMIVLAFDPTGNPADMRRLHVFPVTNGQGTASNQPPREVDYWKDKSTWNGNQAPPLSWLSPLDTQTNLRVSTVATATDYGYALELKIPTTGADAFPLPASGDFGLYVNVMRTDTGQSGPEVVEDSWPPPPDTQLIGVIDTNTPDPSTWGNGSLSGSICNGVHIANTDITANNGTTTLQFPPGSNAFSVNVHNDTVNEQGEPVLAPQIQPTFFIGDFGISLVAPPQIPVGNNPPPPQDIPPANSVAFSTSAWTLTPTQVATYTNDPHQCVMVSLDSKPPSPNPPCNQNPPPPECLRAQILNDVAVQNMHFDVVEQGMNWRGFIAVIPTKLWKPPPGRNYQLVDLHIRTAPILVREGRVALASVGLPTPRDLLWTVNGYRHTAKFVTINRTRYEIVERMGAFGYGLHFAGQQAPEWRYQFFGEEGAQLQQPTKNQNVYRVRIPQGQVGHVNVVFEGDKSAPTGGPQYPKGGHGGERG